MTLSISSFVLLYHALQVRNLVPAAFNVAGVAMPTYAAPTVLKDTPPAGGGIITEAQLQQVTQLVNNGRRVEAYLLLAEWTQCRVFLTTAQIELAPPG